MWIAFAALAGFAGGVGLSIWVMSGTNVRLPW